jgi:squalene-hopene/tetraprenyl-beta-curcumene cyclase
LPQEWFRKVRLHVVSYALPALIAVGQAVFHHRPPRNPFSWLLRKLALGRSLRVLETIQPESGGFLEATPLTSFVVLSLASIGQEKHPVARHGVQFLVESVRPDGSWPIDTNLSTWVTTLAVNALAAAGELEKLERKEGLRSWLVRQQYTSRHPYTGADPGGWAWTPLSGGVPDGDDTPGALLALARLTPLIEDQEPNPSPRAMVRCTITEHPAGAAAAAGLTRLPDLSWDDRPAIFNGLQWLLALHNNDGGWPTFCRGWGHLPFDRSGTDLTAHVLRACSVWRTQVAVDWDYWAALGASGSQATFAHFPLPLVERAMAAGLQYLDEQQGPDGSWVPLWFGNQHAPNDENPTYGTCRVLAAYRDLQKMDSAPARRAVGWLLRTQNADGGWGGAAGVVSSIEETALAVEVLLDAGADAQAAVDRGLEWLSGQIEAGGLAEATPIGFYFARLWYFEKLYPIIFSVAALGRARNMRAAIC